MSEFQKVATTRVTVYGRLWLESMGGLSRFEGFCRVPTLETQVCRARANEASALLQRRADLAQPKQLLWPAACGW